MSSTTQRELQKPVFVAGGSGFVGSEVTRHLLEKGFAVRVLVRKKGRLSSSQNGNLQIVNGNVLSRESLKGVMEGCGALVNLVGIIREKRLRGVTFRRLHVDAVVNLLNEAERAGIERVVHMSALGVKSDGSTGYQTSKFRGEEEVKARALHWTIFRPSIILGPGTGFTSVIRPLVRLPLTPVFGDGKYIFEPVDKRVVAQAFATALINRETYGKTYELRGPHAYTYNEILDALGRATGRKRVRKIHLPLWLVRIMVLLTGWLPFSPVSKGQLEMLVSSRPGTGRDGVEELGLEKIELERQLEYALS